MNKQWWTASFAGGILLLAGCSGETVANRSTMIAAIEPEAAAIPQEPETDEPAAPQVAPTPVPNPTPTTVQLPQSPPVEEQMIPVPNLEPPPPTSLDAPPVTTYRNNPSAAAPVRSVPQRASSNSAGVAPTSAVSPSAASVTPSASSAVTPLPVPAVASPPPVAAVQPTAVQPPNPVPSPGQLANQIEVSGVIQVGGRTSAIVAVPNESTSRYVSVGENLANGIQVKRIDVGADQEPVVVLEQDGVEVYRSVGGL